MNWVRKIKAGWRFIRNKMKALKLNLYRKVYDKRMQEIDFEPSKIKTILLLRWDNKLGDAIMCGNFIKLLRQYRPDIKITVLTGTTTKLWLENAAPADNYIIYNKMKKKQIITDNFGKFDLFVDLGTNCSHKDLCLSSQFKAKHYLGFNKQHYHLFDVEVAPQYVHFKERYIAAAKLLISHPIGEQCQLPLPEFSQQRADLQLFINQAQQQFNHVVGVNLFGSSKYRRFSFEHAKTLILQWRQQFPDDLLVIIPTPGEDKFIARLVTAVNDAMVISPNCLASFEISLAIIDIADFTFTPDTAVVHMASALNKPVIGIYRYNMQNYEEWKPVGMYSQRLLNRKPFSDNDSVHVHEFDWQDLVLARATILKALA
ncbi:Glycosyltransferase family 9 (heptosyltransferase) [Photobacterium malacitanum]|uniref:Glycosyltransferase family 9 (Heptosyltransferase) n=1 Tax=Photobacterium malacitanum TaxID=2204294 RepID=A0A1Y6MKM5_9GAMM|nr:glycosyltransferase family 9 protein [Photobacterium malacitanum]SMY36982.1 Glycosyltransferase family 9 (heptosyltransferase) [Photobacterium malacitanum]